MRLYRVGVLGLDAGTPPLGRGTLHGAAESVRFFLPSLGCDCTDLVRFQFLHRTNALTAVQSSCFRERHFTAGTPYATLVS